MRSFDEIARRPRLAPALLFNPRNMIVLTALEWLAFTQGAHAQALGGSLSLDTGIVTLATALLTVFGALVLVVAAYKGIEATLDHRSVMPSIVGLVFGLALVFGGGWWLTKLGGTGGVGIAGL